MPLKKIRKNSTAAGKKKIIANNMAILFGANKNRSREDKQSTKQVRAAALRISGIKKPKK